VKSSIKKPEKNNGTEGRHQEEPDKWENWYNKLENKIDSLTYHTDRVLAVLEDKPKSLEESDERGASKENRHNIIIGINKISPECNGPAESRWKK